VAVLERKDANEVLVQDGPAKIIRAFWDAKLWRPDGIVEGSEFTLDKLMTDNVVGFTMPYPKLQEKMLGMRKGELTLWTAGSGIGKSTIVRELAYYLHETHGCYIGNIFLEENNVKTAQAYVAIDNNVPLGRLRHNKGLLTPEQWQASLERVVHKGMWFYNHFGSLDSKNLINRIRYLAVVTKVDFVALDHISIATSGLESSSEGERKDIDILMTHLRQVIEETGVGVQAIVHLKRVQGKSFNDGAQVSLSDLRGSASLEQLSDNVIALERDQQGSNPTRMLTRLLKCREMGDLGEADVLNYNRATGRVELDASTPFDEVVD
ncbi:MAG: DnaB-like helicase C-terminal domain-containing protein, partial [Acidobacteriaceae bacterium]